MIPQPLVYTFGEIVALTSAAVLSDLQAVDSNITGVRYDYGKWIDLKENLIQKDNNPDLNAKKAKYPVIMMFEDITIRKGGTQYWGIARDLRFLIAMSSQADLKSSERQLVFDNILNPIYEEFMYQIKSHEAFGSAIDVNGIDHEFTDRKYSGKYEIYGNAGNTFTDFLEVKEISQMDLTIVKSTCLQPINVL